MPTINELNAISSPSGSDLLAVFSTSNGDARKLSLTNFATWLATQQTAQPDKITQYAAPAASAVTIQVNDASDSVWLIVTPSATHAAGTIKLPLSTNVIDKQEILVTYGANGVTSLTVDGNGCTVSGAPATMAANAYFLLRFDAVMQTWYRVG